MGVVNGIKMGLMLVESIATVFITIYGTLLVGLILLGVISNIAQSGDINVTDQSNETMSKLDTGIVNTVGSITSPIGVISSLIVVAVLVMMFPNFSLTGNKGSKNSGGGVL